MSFQKEKFPSGKRVDDWFYSIKPIDESSLGNRYVITDYGAKSDGQVYTKEIQSLIDKVHGVGGGVIVVPKGTFMTGALFFKQNVHLCVEQGAVLKGSDDICDYPLMETRIEGQTCTYFSALINADNLNGFIMYGGGVIDGNGQRAYRAFWQRLKWNKNATNKDEQRARLIYISNCKDVTVCGLTFQNSQYWTNHLYKCTRVRYINCTIFSPKYLAPSTDAIDIDACSMVHVKDCKIGVNDDAIVMKGGKGVHADKDENNGKSEFVLMEDCVVDFAHSCFTCGSECIHADNVIIKNVKVNNAVNFLWLKMRPDTPQLYENIVLKNCDGFVNNLLNVNPWTQFFDLGGEKEIPLSYANNVSISDCTFKCDNYFNVKKEDSQYILSNFNFKNLQITATNDDHDYSIIKDMKVENVSINKD